MLYETVMHGTLNALVNNSLEYVHARDFMKAVNINNVMWLAFCFQFISNILFLSYRHFDSITFYHE